MARAPALRPPSQFSGPAPRKPERLRFTPWPTHSETMMAELTTALVEIWDRLELELRRAI
jgi:hypothetical protein